MIRATLDRVGAVERVLQPIIVTNADHAGAIGRELKGSPFAGATLILEPVGRNTAPAVAVAAIEAVTDGSDPLLLILPSDHTIGDEDAFVTAVQLAAPAAEDGHLVTFGITPRGPETGYGYLRTGEPIADGIFRVDEFREKPDLETATEYLDSGRYLWNAGMFLIRASVYLSELTTFAPAMVQACRQACEGAKRSDGLVSLDRRPFEAMTGDSIDYAVMEKTTRAAVVPVDPGWNDVGSWASLWDVGVKDEHDNVIMGDAILHDVTGAYVRGSDRLIAIVGVDDVVIVDTPDALLVTTRDRAQDVKVIVDRLAEEGRKELQSDGKEDA